MSEEKDFEYDVLDEKMLEDYFIHTTQGGEKSFVSYDADEFDGTTWKTIWTHDDCRTILRRFTQLKKDLKAIAERYDEIGGDERKAGELLSPALFQVWETYVSEFKSEEFDKAQIDDISRRFDVLDERERVTSRLANGWTLTEEFKEILEQTEGITVTEEEEELVSQYCIKRCADAHRRVGANVFAYQLVLRARRCCKHYHEKTTGFVIDVEEHLLADAMIRHTYGKRIR